MCMHKCAKVLTIIINPLCISHGLCTCITPLLDMHIIYPAYTASGSCLIHFKLVFSSFKIIYCNQAKEHVEGSCLDTSLMMHIFTVENFVILYNYYIISGIALTVNVILVLGIIDKIISIINQFEALEDLKSIQACLIGWGEKDNMPSPSFSNSFTSHPPLKPTQLWINTYYICFIDNFLLFCTWPGYCN